MIKAFIFDMDGVLIDSEPLHLQFSQELFKELQIQMSIEDYSKFVGTTSKYMWGVIKDRYSLKNTVDELIKMEREGFFKYLSSVDIEPIDYIPELLNKLNENNFKTAVASSSPINVIEFIIKSFKLETYFNELVTGDYVSKSKPNPDVFLYAAKKLNVLPEECVVIEDSHNGVLAAKNAGMKCIGFKNPHSGKQDLSKADMLISSFREIDIFNL
ncbi:MULTISPECIES: HAD family hydrolase [Clostridium]|uniref:HAD family hydrolase n=1 Tax=Clostridium TaxID=1485 RepID=UPI000824E25C|nr:MULTISPECIES: HAD family phosphatase [Clostridium]PJI07722.1 HAD family phosphatase [Clostridium sp. CT7]